MGNPVAWLRDRRAQRDAQAAALIEELRLEARGHGRQVVHVLNVYQRAKRGSKAAIIHDATGARRDAWFWWTTVLKGQTLLVNGGSGWGPHHRREVLYIGKETHGPGVIRELPPGTWRAAQRHDRRRAKGHRKADRALGYGDRGQG